MAAAGIPLRLFARIVARDHPSAREQAMKPPTHPNGAAFPDGLSGPALRALNGAGIRSMQELEAWTEQDLAKLHGMGPKGIRILREALARRGRGFRDP